MHRDKKKQNFQNSFRSMSMFFLGPSVVKEQKSSNFGNFRSFNGNL